jgi:periplasmic divalent cation tolerance protein
MEDQLIVVYCTCPDARTAEYIAEIAVSELLAACASIIPGLNSIYRWQGKVYRTSEVLLILKTQEITYQLLETRICELHPYEVPEIIALPIHAGATHYLDWLKDNTSAPLL